MLKNAFFILIVVLAFGCSGGKELTVSEVDIETQDSTEYELIVLETGFDAWFATHRKPVWYHTEDFYKRWNTIYTNEWNFRVTSSQFGEPYDNQINYEWNVDYGIHLEHKLYWYFKFLEDKYNIKLDITSNR
jgi:hypothetical protein